MNIVTLIASRKGIIQYVDREGNIGLYLQRGMRKCSYEQLQRFVAAGLLDKRVLAAQLIEAPKNVTFEIEERNAEMGKQSLSFSLDGGYRIKSATWSRMRRTADLLHLLYVEIVGPKGGKYIVCESAIDSIVIPHISKIFQRGVKAVDIRKACEMLGREVKVVDTKPREMVRNLFLQVIRAQEKSR